MEITLYLVGKDKNEAQETWPFDSYESAESYRDDQEDGEFIWTVTAVVDFSTIEKVEV